MKAVSKIFKCLIFPMVVILGPTNQASYNYLTNWAFLSIAAAAFRLFFGQIFGRRAKPQWLAG